MNMKLTVKVPPAQAKRIMKLHKLACEAYNNVSTEDERLALGNCLTSVAALVYFEETRRTVVSHPRDEQ